MNLRADRRHLCQARSAWVFPRPQMWFQAVRRLNDDAVDFWYKENFRISKKTFDAICQIVSPAIHRQHTTMRDAVPVEIRVATSLWRLATGDSYRTCGLMFGLAKPTAIYCCHEFVREICNLQDQFIKFPRTQAEIKTKIEGFGRKSKIPNVVAVIDGSHIPKKDPAVNHEDYFNRKHVYSFMVQGVVDSSSLFLSVATGFPGSLHDARMLRLTDLFLAAENGDILFEPTLDLSGTVVRPFILGDSAYPKRNWLLQPFKVTGHLNGDQRKYNKELSKARIVSEHAFGLTKGSWRVLLKRLDEDSDRVPSTIIACCVLHNICILENDDTPIDIVDSDDDDNERDDGPPCDDADDIQAAIVQWVANH